MAERVEGLREGQSRWGLGWQSQRKGQRGEQGSPWRLTPTPSRPGARFERRRVWSPSRYAGCVHRTEDCVTRGGSHCASAVPFTVTTAAHSCRVLAGSPPCGGRVSESRGRGEQGRPVEDRGARCPGPGHAPGKRPGDSVLGTRVTDRRRELFPPRTPL